MCERIANCSQLTQRHHVRTLGPFMSVAQTAHVTLPNTKSGGMIFIQPTPLWHTYTCVFTYFCWRPVITGRENKIPLLGVYSRERQKRMKESQFQQRPFQHCFKVLTHYFHCQNDGFCLNFHLAFKIILKRSR